MKYAIVSDIHGNLAALKAALADARTRGCEKFVCLGDLTGYGDEAVACVELARKTFDVCLMGNHDSACCGLEHPEIVKLVRSYEKDVAAREQLSADAMKWLSERPYTFATKLFACAHSEFAAPKDWNYIELPPNAWPSLWTRKEQILFVGHTHVPVIMAMGPESVRLSRSFDEQEMLAGMRGLKALTKTSGLVKPGVRYVVNDGRMD